MKSFKDISLLVIIAGLIIILFLQRGCTPHPTDTNPTVITKIETRYDTIVDTITEYVPKWKTRTVRDTQYFPSDIDTNEILKDYFASYYYEDSIIRGDSVKIYIKDTITENKIKSRQINYSLLHPVTTIYKETLINKNEFYVGIGMVGNQSGLYYIGPELLLRTKNKQAYGLGVGVDGNLRPTLSLKTYWKIGKK
jgi:hypothetical protein